MNINKNISRYLIKEISLCFSYLSNLKIEKVKFNLQAHKSLILLILSLIMLIIFLLNLALGSVSIPFSEVINILVKGESSQTTWTQIILQLRLPKAITAALAGSALATSGLQMQTLFHNPLAGPFILGINAGASLGVAIVVLATGITGIYLGIFQDLSLVLAASLGASLVLGIILFISRYIRSNTTLLILGLMFGYAASSLVSILLHFSNTERMQAYLNWTFGSFAGVTNNQLPIFAIVVILGLSITQILAKPLNALLLGENYAQSIGLSVEKIRLWLILSSSILAGAVTAFCGPIAFLGVAVPHLCRALFQTADHRLLLPAVIIMGTILALIADLVAQLPGSELILPLNAVTSLIGAPIVTWVILRKSYH